jgi:hypothetical protein
MLYQEFKDQLRVFLGGEGGGWKILKSLTKDIMLIIFYFENFCVIKYNIRSLVSLCIMVINSYKCKESL